MDKAISTNKENRATILLSEPQDIFFMQQALGLAMRAQTLDEVPVGAVVVFNNEVIGEGYNCPISFQDPTAHAEVIALREASKKLTNYRLPGIDLYVTLEPCIMCVGAMIHARIRRLIFGATDPKAGAVISVFEVLDTKKLNHRVEFKSGVLATECGKILLEFFKNKR